MAIGFYKGKKVFKLDTKQTSYIFCVSDNDFIEHLYYGKYINDVDVKSISNRQIYSFGAKEQEGARDFSIGTVLHELSIASSGDLRTPSVIIDFNGESVSNRFRYKSHTIYKGRKGITGMPYSRNNGECDTLEIVLKNDSDTVRIILYYTVYEKEDVICRHIELINEKLPCIYLEKAASACLDFYGSDYDFITLEGMYLCERSKVQRLPLRKGFQGDASIVGTTSHHANPFFALCSKNADENLGEAYGFNIVYSSNFKNEIEVDRLSNTRIVCGINDVGFRWKLNIGERFETPEIVMTFSDEGLGGMSRNMHDHIRNNIIERRYAFAKRPVVINSWEAAYFDVTEDKLLSLARSAKECGVDTVVLDDGWFRKNDKGGLGDFFVDKEKFPSGLKKLSEEIHALGLKFGIWLEPEMVALESEFYKNHAKDILSLESKPLIYRNQFLIDLTVAENVEKIKNRILEELSGVEIEYIKWDCNRYLNEASSKNSPQGEVFHRQMLGVYKLLDGIKENFPDTMFETCSGGGGRFDLGMLYYSPQIWTSDNTDPFARIYIEYGTSLAYPKSTVSCHFSEGVCTSGRLSSYDFRYIVASFGPFGYELDLSKYTKDDWLKFKEYSLKYRKNEKIMLEGDLYRLISPESDEFCAYIEVSKDKTRALFTFIEINTTGHTESMVVRLKGLATNKWYKNEETGQILTGGALMNVGIRVGDLFKEKGGSGRQILFSEQSQDI